MHKTRWRISKQKGIDVIIKACRDNKVTYKDLNFRIKSLSENSMED